MSASDTRVVELLEHAWGELHQVCRGLKEAEWARPTDCPGWSVKDHLAHIAGTEARLLGRPPPVRRPAGTDPPHVHNEIGRSNEIEVESRRPWPGPRVLAEFKELTAARIRALRRYTEADFDRKSWTPKGPGTVGEFLAIRVLDAWIHDQDIRRALGRPGHQAGRVAEHTMGRLLAGMSFVVGKRVAPADGTTVVFDIDGPAGTSVAVAQDGGRAKVIPTRPPRPTAILTMDQDTFVRLVCGRGDPKTLFEEGAFAVLGDEALGRAVADSMNIMP